MMCAAAAVAVGVASVLLAGAPAVHAADTWSVDVRNTSVVLDSSYCSSGNPSIYLLGGCYDTTGGTFTSDQPQTAAQVTDGSCSAAFDVLDTYYCAGEDSSGNQYYPTLQVYDASNDTRIFWCYYGSEMETIATDSPSTQVCDQTAGDWTATFSVSGISDPTASPTNSPAPSTTHSPATTSPTMAPTVSVSTTFEETIIPTGLASYDYFGYDCELAGAYAVCGAPYTDYWYTNDGETYVYVQDEVTQEWSLDQSIAMQVADADSYDYFGFSSALGITDSNKYLVVGAYGDDDTAYQGGRAYTFVYNSGTGSWDTEQTLAATPALTYAQFGYDMDMSVGTVPGDGSSAILAVGAPMEYSGTSENGSVYIFYRDSTQTTWAQSTAIYSPLAAGNFGFSVALNGTLLIVGAPGALGGRGRAIVYRSTGDTGTGDEWTQEKMLQAPKGGSINDYFGRAVAIMERNPMTGRSAAVACAWAANDEGLCTVSEAKAKTKNGNVTYTWSRVATLTPPGSFQSDLRFGVSVALSGAAGLLVVGASGYNTYTGVVYIYEIADWTHVTTISDESAGTYSYYGFSVAIREDAASTNTPAKTVLVGGYGVNAAFTTDSGAVHVYDFGCGDHCDCAVGTGFSSTAGIEYCADCLAGNYSFANGSAEPVCLPCATGTVSTYDGATNCTACDPGYTSSSDNTKCIQCDENEYSKGGEGAVCLACPGGSLSSAGSNSKSDCEKQNLLASFTFAFIALFFLVLGGSLFVCTARIRETSNEERLTRFRDMLAAIASLRRIIVRIAGEVAKAAAYVPRTLSIGSVDDPGGEGCGTEKDRKRRERQRNREQGQDKSPTMQTLRRHGRLIAAVCGFILIVIFIWVATMLTLVADAYLVLNSARALASLDQLKDVVSSVAQVLDVVGMGWFIRGFGFFTFELFSLSFRAITVSGLGVTCSGSQGVSALMLNLAALVFIGYVLEFHILEITQSILRSTFERLAGVKRHEQKTRQKALVFVYAGIGIAIQSAFVFFVQTVAGMVSFSWATSTDTCDSSSATGNMDTTLAALSNTVLVLLFLPAIQLLLTVAVPSIPRNENMFQRVKPLDQTMRPEWLDKVFVLSAFRGMFSLVTWQCHQAYRAMSGKASAVKHEVSAQAIGVSNLVSVRRCASVMHAAVHALAIVEDRWLVSKALELDERAQRRLKHKRHSRHHRKRHSARNSANGGRDSSGSGYGDRGAEASTPTSPRSPRSGHSDVPSPNASGAATYGNGNGNGDGDDGSSRGQSARFTWTNPAHMETPGGYEWFYIDPRSDKQEGPFAASAMHQRWESGQIPATMQVRLRTWPRFVSAAALQLSVGDRRMFYSVPRLPALVVQNDRIQREHDYEEEMRQEEERRRQRNNEWKKRISRRFSGTPEPGDGESPVTGGPPTPTATAVSQPSSKSSFSSTNGSDPGARGSWRPMAFQRMFSDQSEGSSPSDALRTAAIQMRDYEHHRAMTERSERESRKRASMIDMDAGEFKELQRPTERVAYRKCGDNFVWLEIPSPLELVASLFAVPFDEMHLQLAHVARSWGWAINHKIWTLLSLTFGALDDDIIVSLRLRWKQHQFSDMVLDQATGNTARHLADRQVERRRILARAAQAHAIAWQVLPAAVILSKFSARMNESPIALFALHSDEITQPDQEAIEVAGPETPRPGDGLALGTPPGAPGGMPGGPSPQVPGGVRGALPVQAHAENPLDLGRFIFDIRISMQECAQDINPDATPSYRALQVGLHFLRGVDHWLEHSRIVAWLLAAVDFSFLVGAVTSPSVGLMGVYSTLILSRALPQAASAFFRLAQQVSNKAEQHGDHGDRASEVANAGANANGGGGEESKEAVLEEANVVTSTHKRDQQQAWRSCMVASMIATFLMFLVTFTMTVVSSAACGAEGCKGLGSDVAILLVLLYLSVLVGIAGCFCGFQGWWNTSHWWLFIQLRTEILGDILCVLSFFALITHAIQVNRSSGAHSHYFRRVSTTGVFACAAIWGMMTAWKLLVTRHIHRLRDPSRAARNAQLLKTVGRRRRTESARSSDSYSDSEFSDDEEEYDSDVDDMDQDGQGENGDVDVEEGTARHQRRRRRSQRAGNDDGHGVGDGAEGRQERSSSIVGMLSSGLGRLRRGSASAEGGTAANSVQAEAVEGIPVQEAEVAEAVSPTAVPVEVVSEKNPPVVVVKDVQPQPGDESKATDEDMDEVEEDEDELGVGTEPVSERKVYTLTFVVLQSLIWLLMWIWFFTFKAQLAPGDVILGFFGFYFFTAGYMDCLYYRYKDRIGEIKMMEDGSYFHVIFCFPFWLSDKLNAKRCSGVSISRRGGSCFNVFSHMKKEWKAGRAFRFRRQTFLLALGMSFILLLICLVVGTKAADLKTGDHGFISQTVGSQATHVVALVLFIIAIAFHIVRFDASTDSDKKSRGEDEEEDDELDGSSVGEQNAGLGGNGYGIPSATTNPVAAQPQAPLPGGVAPGLPLGVDV